MANWLIAHNIPFERQVRVGRFTVDFQIADSHTYVEVNGCYWHGCLFHCRKLETKQVQRSIARDIRLAELCHAHSYTLITIWEHSINADDFSGLATLL